MDSMTPIPSFRAKNIADAIEKRYYQNTRATTSRLAAELRSEYEPIRRAALLRLVRRLGFAGARAVYRHTYGYPDWYRTAFRTRCVDATDAVFARGRDE